MIVNSKLGFLEFSGFNFNFNFKNGSGSYSFLKKEDHW